MQHIVLLHGALGTASDFDQLTKLLSEAGLVPHTMTFSGHGDQAFAPSFSIEQFQLELQAFLLAHALEHAAIFGYSMGGFVALQLAQTSTVVKGPIITVATKLEWTTEIAEKEARVCSAEFLKEKAPAYYQTLQKRHTHADALLQATQQLLLEMPNLPALQAFHLKNKTVLLVGDLDKLVSIEETKRLAEQLPDGRFAILPQTKHPLDTVDVRMLAKHILTAL